MPKLPTATPFARRPATSAAQVPPSTALLPSPRSWSRPWPNADPAAYNPVTYAVLIGLKTIALRHQYLDGQISYLTEAIIAVVATTNPSLLAAHGVGPDTAAQAC